MHHHSPELVHRQTMPKSHQQAANRITWIGMLVDIVIGLLKIVVGVVSFSYSLIADGIHSFSDAVTDILVIGLTKYAHQAPDQDHPYGHERFETFGTVVLGSVLVAVAGAMLWDSIQRFSELGNHPLPEWPALAIAGLSIIAKEVIFRYTLRVGEHIKSDLIIANAWHSRTDAMSSVVVLIGIAGAMMGYLWLDLAAAIIVALIIAKVGSELTWDAIKQLVDTALSPEFTKELTEFIQETKEVKSVHDLRSRHMGSMILLDMHLQVDPSISVSEGHQIGLVVSKRLRKAYGNIADITFHIDAEDDHQPNHVISHAYQLPLRSHALENLLACWSPHLPEESRPRFSLHYLNNKVSVDIFLHSTEAMPSELHEKLTAASQHLPWLGSLQIWIKQA